MLNCQNLTILLERKEDPLILVHVGITILHFLLFLGWLIHFWISTAIIPRVEIVFFHIQNFPDRSEVPEVISSVQLDTVSQDSPPTYEDLFGKDVDEVEDDASLPGYDMASKKEEFEVDEVVV